MKNVRWTRAIPKVLDGLTRISMGSGVCILLILMLVIVVHSMGRYFFSESLLWIMEACAYAFMAIVFLCLGPTQKANRHVKVDILEAILPPGISRFLRGFLTPLISLVYAVYFIWSSGIMTMRFYEKGSVGLDLDFMPLALPAVMIPIGLTIFSLVLIGIIVRYLVERRRPKEGIAEEEMDSSISL